MIAFYTVNKFCKDDVSLIENYEQALADPEMWHCHHRLETDLGLSADELKEQNRYFNVPASELIFLTHSDHMKLHNHGENHPMYGKRGKDSPIYGENNPMYGKNAEDYMSEEAVKEKRLKQSIARKEWWKKHKKK